LAACVFLCLARFENSAELVHGRLEEMLSSEEPEEVCAIVALLRDLDKRRVPVDECLELRRIAAGGSAYARAVVAAGGVIADHHFAEARQLLGLAAAQGAAGAQDMLGTMHYDGLGGPKDLAEARRLVQLQCSWHVACAHPAPWGTWRAASTCFELETKTQTRGTKYTILHLLLH